MLAQPDTLRYRARKFVGRNRLAVTAAAVFISCIAAFGIVATAAGTGARRAGSRRPLGAGQGGTGRASARRPVRDHQSGDSPGWRSDACSRVSRRRRGPGPAQLSGAPLVKAKLKQVFGLIHYERGEYTPARDALEEALAEQRRLVGPDRPDALESLTRSAGVYDAGDESRARSPPRGVPRPASPSLWRRTREDRAGDVRACSASGRRGSQCGRDTAHEPSKFDGGCWRRTIRTWP